MILFADYFCKNGIGVLRNPFDTPEVWTGFPEFAEDHTIRADPMPDLLLDNLTNNKILSSSNGQFLHIVLKCPVETSLNDGWGMR